MKKRHITRSCSTTAAIGFFDSMLRLLVLATTARFATVAFSTTKVNNVHILRQISEHKAPSCGSSFLSPTKLAVGISLSSPCLTPSSLSASSSSSSSFSRWNPRRWNRRAGKRQPEGLVTQSKTKTSPSSLYITDDTSIQETALQRMRRRKVNILKKKKVYGTSYLLALWYVLSIEYNIFSKKGLNMAPELAWTAAFIQMSGGLLAYVFPIWFVGKVRKPPKLSGSDMRRLLPVAFLHSLVHIGGVVSMGAGAVSFTYIVKASEPAVSAGLATLTGTILHWSVYLTLFPIMCGVALASVSELTFTWKSFNYAMMSNIASSCRAVVGKKSINQRLGDNMSPMNLYAVLTIMSSLFLIPLTLIMEGSVLSSGIQKLVEAKLLSRWFLNTFLASIFYYTYNEVAFLCLDNISPVSHAIANTVKRVFIIATSIIVFGNKITMRGFLGSVLAVGGVLLYSLQKNKHPSKSLKQKKDEAEEEDIEEDD